GFLIFLMCISFGLNFRRRLLCVKEFWRHNTNSFINIMKSHLLGFFRQCVRTTQPSPVRRYLRIVLREPVRGTNRTELFGLDALSSAAIYMPTYGPLHA